MSTLQDIICSAKASTSTTLRYVQEPNALSLTCSVRKKVREPELIEINQGKPGSNW